MNQTDPPSTPPDDKGDAAVKQTIESIVIALVLAFIFRAYVVEAFVIPTGSMAPTLLGEHLRLNDPQTGYTFRVNPPYGTADRTPLIDRPPRSPMSGTPIPVPPGTLPRSGDRILVHKYIYAFSEPQRWDVVVFKAPQLPGVNYIKRLVALPEEQLFIFDGNIFTASGLPASSSRQFDAFHIARKTDPQTNHHWQKVQRAVWQPIYHSQYVPLDLQQAARDGWQTPWVAQRGNWHIDSRRSYRFDNTPSDDNAGTANFPGMIRFDFARSGDNTWQMEYPYNQVFGNPAVVPYEGFDPIEEIRLAAGVEPDNENLVFHFATTARLGNPASPFERLTAEVDAADGKVRLLAESMVEDADGKMRLLAETEVAPLPTGVATDVELWYVDQEAIVWIAGQPVLRHRFDQSLAQRQSLPAPTLVPQITIAASEAMTLHRVELDRDLYYESSRASGSLARGGMMRVNDKIRSAPAVVLTEDEFFVLGDNSPASEDSRFWDYNPLETRDHRLIEDTFFQPESRDHAGIVPRELMIGRAFFVYFPAPLRVGPLRLPNFGDMRFIW